MKFGLHLARRFLRSLVARPPGAGEEAWVAGVLTPAELELWRRHNRYDRRHTYEVARDVERRLGEDAGVGRVWVAAALLHDVGKIEAGAGLLARVVATVAKGALGRERVAGWGGRLGRYVDHGRRGAEMIRAAGGREEAAHWASVHHLVDEDSGDPGGIVPDRAVQALRAADSD